LTISERQNGLKIGHVAPDFVLPDDQMKVMTLNQVMCDHGGLLAFVHGLWCPVCVQVLFRLRQYAHIYSNEGFGVAVVTSDQPRSLQVFKRSACPPVKFPLLADENGVVREMYQLAQAGAYYVIDRNKIVREKFLDVAHRGWPGHPHILSAMRRVRSLP
jgi:peroxiredoxin